ncbi:hypothetical protein HII17_04105 [Thalassotalea sp. M1531]|uniref:Uncharacterized protein n=1 Tax=Thalassotalea algicola TaxID=2716224 RepID=A0A7Y0Q567_9GAMM|nr:hypothetical protein [Thalassotalea algicola]NMP30739.1 hypothetical protein [Thalassotalea algicola]
MKKIALLFAVVSGTAFAQVDIQQQMIACKSESDSLKRLVCYDQITELLVAKTDFTKTSTAEVNVVNEAAVKPIAAVSAVKADETNPTKLAEKPQANSARAEAIFGQEQKQRDDIVDEVHFVIKSAKLSLRKKWQFVFENGQRWEQKDTDRFAKFEAGQEVIIKRGIMNAFYLKKQDANRTIRVKRTK